MYYHLALVILHNMSLEKIPLQHGNMARTPVRICIFLHHQSSFYRFGSYFVRSADGSTVSIVCELAVNGSLEQALRGSGIAGAPNPIAARQIAIGIARSLTLFQGVPSFSNSLPGCAPTPPGGIAYLHSLEPAVAHNDLKSGNVLLSQVTVW